MGLFLFGIGILVAFLAALAGMEAKDVGASLGGVIGGIVGAAGAFLGVQAAIQREDNREKDRSALELQSLRSAIYAEVKITSILCYRLCSDFSKIMSQSEISEKIFELRMPESIVFRSVSSQIGLLSSEEVSPLVKYQHTLEDIRIIEFSERNSPHLQDDKFRIYFLLSNACEYAACFLAATPEPVRSSEDMDYFIPELRRLRRESDEERQKRIPGYVPRYH
jgi:hypothetical protein